MRGKTSIVSSDITNEFDSSILKFSYRLISFQLKSSADVWDVSHAVQTIKANVLLTDIIRNYTNVIPTRNPLVYKALCPFHDDNDPSLNIDDSRGLYHCFSCIAGGDSIRFVQDIENVSFVESVYLIASRFPSKVRVPYGLTRKKGNGFLIESKETFRKKENMTRALQKASAFYSHKLMQVSYAG